MRMHLLLLVFTLLCCGPPLTQAAEPLPDYVRFREDARSARLEVAIRRLALPTGQHVDLIGAIHIADDAYYQEINRRFADYDSVLFELVGDPEHLTKSPPLPAGQRNQFSGGSAVGTLQLAAAQYLKLTFQLGAVDYTGKNMVHADATPEQFARMQAERGETMLTLFARAMQAQMGGKLDRAANELDTFALIRILMSPDSAGEFKRSLARMFDQMESITAAMEGSTPSAIVGGRNTLVVDKAREVLARKAQRRIAVFYGAAHMPGIEGALVREFQARPAGEEWLAAWTLPAVAAAAPPAR